MAASESFPHPTTRVHELWQTDFTYFKIIGWGWYYLGSILDEYSRYIIAWKLFTTMASTDVKTVLDIAVEKTGVEYVAVRHRPRLLSDNGPAYVSEELERYLASKGMTQTHGAPFHPMTQGKIEPPRGPFGTVSPVDEERDQSPEILSALGTRTGDRTLRHLLQQRAISRGPGQCYTGGCMLRQASRDHHPERTTQAADTEGEKAIQSVTIYRSNHHLAQARFCPNDFDDIQLGCNMALGDIVSSPIMTDRKPRAIVRGDNVLLEKRKKIKARTLKARRSQTKKRLEILKSVS